MNGPGHYELSRHAYTVALLAMLAGCYSFDKDIAVNEFKELKPACEIIKMTDYECDGTLGECWYVEFKYKCMDSAIPRDTTLQYWKVDNEWITRKEFKQRSQ